MRCGVTYPATFLGIDPGLDGYLVALVQGEEKPRFHPAPLLEGKSSKGKRRYNRPALLELVLDYAQLMPELCLLEKQQPMPKNGGVANFASGYGFALWEMALTAARIPYDTPASKTWKAQLGVMGVGSSTATRRRDGKRRAVELAQKLYPGVSLLPTERCRVPSSDMAEALLLAHLARKA